MVRFKRQLYNLLAVLILQIGLFTCLNLNGQAEPEAPFNSEQKFEGNESVQLVVSVIQYQLRLPSNIFFAQLFIQGIKFLDTHYQNCVASSFQCQHNLYQTFKTQLIVLSRETRARSITLDGIS